MADDFKKYPPAKKRSLSDLVEFVKTRTSSVTNYTLLLGAGASVTSGIQSAGCLIEQWRKEMYQRLCSSPVHPYEPEEAKRWLSQHHPEWYSAQREYSSLFEKKFDLPRQRRMFVEQQVSDKMPNLGYAYLTRLVDHSFFNTIFTTNFDDLLNESFHQFSDVRPLVCAHDSSISSITVTSKRPKIVKLHGDYLFDDIKSTLRETESLEENTKKKFSEFAKDHGLIVLGYAGHDRSIMDVLQYLLKQDEYFKHGLYWCVRAGDICSDELAKLLWKERAYWVAIDGFDEFMATLHRECIGDALPIDTALVSEKPRYIVSRFCKSEYLSLSKCEPIRQDLAKLKRELEREALVDSLRTITRDDGDDSHKPRGLRDPDLIKLLTIGQLIEAFEYPKASEKINEALISADKPDFRERLLLKRLEIEEKTSNRVSALRTCEALIASDDRNASFWLARARNEKDPESRIRCVDQAIAIDPYYPTAFRMRAIYRREQLGSDPHCNVAEISTAVAKDYETSLTLSPGISNPAWKSYAYFLSNKRTLNLEPRQTMRRLLERLELLDPECVTSLSIAMDYLDKFGSDGEKTEGLIRIREAIAHQARSSRRELRLLLLRSLKRFHRKDELISELNISDAETELCHDSDYIDLRSEVFAEVEGKIHDAIRCIEVNKQYAKDETLLASMLSLLILLNRSADARKLFDEYSKVLHPDIRYSIDRDILESASNYEGALNAIRRQSEAARYPAQDVVHETHILLKLARWSEAESVARKVLVPANFSHEFDALIVNLEISVLRQGRKADKGRLARLAADPDVDPRVHICCYFLLDDREQALRILKEAIEKDRTLAYQMQRWALFDSPGNRAWLKQSLEDIGRIPHFSFGEFANEGVARA